MAAPASLKAGIGVALVYGVVALCGNFVHKYSMRLFPVPFSVLLMQLTTMYAGVQALHMIGCIQLPALTQSKLRQLLPLALLHSGHSLLVLRSLATLNVPMYNTLKRMTPVIVLVSKSAIDRKLPDGQVAAAIAFIVLGCVVAGAGDLAFTFYGYALALTCALAQAMYILLAEYAGIEQPHKGGGSPGSSSSQTGRISDGMGSANSSSSFIPYQHYPTHHKHPGYAPLPTHNNFMHQGAGGQILQLSAPSLSLSTLPNLSIPLGVAGHGNRSYSGGGSLLHDTMANSSNHTALGVEPSSLTLGSLLGMGNRRGSSGGTPPNGGGAGVGGGGTHIARSSSLGEALGSATIPEAMSFDSIQEGSESPSTPHLKNAEALDASILSHRQYTSSFLGAEGGGYSRWSLTGRLASGGGFNFASPLSPEARRSMSGGGSRGASLHGLRGISGSGGHVASSASSPGEIVQCVCLVNIPLLAVAVWAAGEIPKVLPLLEVQLLAMGPWTLMAWVTLIASFEGMLTGSLLACTQMNSALTTSVVGVLKGTVAVCLGFFIMNAGAKFSTMNVCGISMNTCGGAWYAWAKWRQSQHAKVHA